jgi:opacity protein-like surface antigen
MRKVLLLTLLLVCAATNGQDRPLLRSSSDAELWLSTGIERRFYKEKKKSKKERTPEQQEKDAAKQRKLEHSFKYNFRLTGEAGYRGNENLTSSKLVYTVLGVRYRFHKYARLTLEHRYNFRDKYTTNTQRVDVQADSDVDLGAFNLGYRMVFQHENMDIDPYVSIETFTAMHFTGNKVISLRYGAGAEWSISKDHTLDLSLRYDREQNIPGMQYRWILGAAYEFKWRP